MAEETRLLPHTHPVSAIIRNHFEALLLRRYAHGKRVKSVGGNDVRHARDHAAFNIHSCCPILDGTDEIRDAKRATKVRGEHCSNRFQDCAVEADVYLFSHSLYYISQFELACVPTGSIILAIHNVYPGPGTYTFGEVRVEHANGNLLVHTRGNDHPYVHPPVWLKSECCISTGHSVITFVNEGRIDVSHAYRGLVRPVSLDDRLLAPVDVPHEEPTYGQHHSRYP